MSKLTEFAQVFFRHLLTGKDNQTYDIGRILWLLSGLVFLALSIYDVLQGNPFRCVHFGAGAASILAGGGGGLALKKSTEPD